MKHVRSSAKVVTHSTLPSASEILEDYKKLVQINQSRLSALEDDSIRFGLNVQMIPLDELYKEDIRDGLGFDIDTSVIYDTKTMVIIDNMIDSMGIYSYQFGPRDEDPPSVKAKRFQCRCGKTVSSYSGEICPECNTETVLIEKIRGWIYTKYRVFNPFWFDIFSRNIRPIEPKDKIGRRSSSGRKGKDKKLLSYIKEDLTKFKVNMIQNRWNLIDLQEDRQLEAFVRYYCKPERLDEMLLTLKCAMTHHVPVLSKNYRHFSITPKLDGTANVQTHPINNHYIDISINANTLNQNNEYASSQDKIKGISAISEAFQQIKDKMYEDLLEDKKSLIRNILFGGRMANSGRAIVSAITTNHRLDVCTLPYNLFGEVFQQYYKDIFIKHGATPEALARMSANCPIDSDKDIMDHVLAEMQENHWAFVLINRAPCIYFGSQISCKIVELRDEDVVRINDIVLDGNLHGDKDGDNVMFCALDRAIALSIFLALNPYRITFNPVTGEVNSAHSLIEGGYMCVYLALKKKVKTTVEMVE